MTPKSFDETTCKELIGHDKVLHIETRARKLVEDGETIPPFTPLGETYWSGVLEIAEYVILTTTYLKRVERLKRMQENPVRDHRKR